MRTISKTSALALILFLALSSLTVFAVKPSTAQAIPPPSVPQFTIQFVNSSIGVPTTNPYTGENSTQQISNESIQLTITNQNNYALLSQPVNYHIYYAVRLRPHFGGDWIVLDTLSSRTSSPGTNGNSPQATYIIDLPSQSSSNITVITFLVTPTTDSQSSGYIIHPMYSNDGSIEGPVPYGSQFDFQVEALVGHNSTFWAPDPNPDIPWHPYGSTPPPMPPQGSYVPAIAYDNLNSTWSSTQTVTIGQASTPSWSSPTCESPALPAWSWLIALSLLVAAILIALVLERRKKP
jgi:hypothetical protein